MGEPLPHPGSSLPSVAASEVLGFAPSCALCSRAASDELAPQPGPITTSLSFPLRITLCSLTWLVAVSHLGLGT